MATLLVLHTNLYTHKVERKLTLPVADGLTITEDNAVDLLIDIGFIQRDDDFEANVDFFRDCESITSNQHAYVFDLEETTVTMTVV